LSQTRLNPFARSNCLEEFSYGIPACGENA
jgi:hypothetical protein